MAQASGVDDALIALERAAEALGAELVRWRERAAAAETELEAVRNQVPAFSPDDIAALRQRIDEGEAENQRLRGRIEGAREQLEQLRTRVRFMGGQTAGERR